LNGGEITARDKIRLLILATHPIQYQAPLFRRLATSEVIDACVVFLTDFGVAPSFDSGFARKVAFDIPLTEGYEHRFLSTGGDKLGRYYLPPRHEWSRIKWPEFDVVLPPGYASLATWIACIAATRHNVPYLMRGETRIETDTRRPIWRRWAKRQVLGPLLRRAGACLSIGTSNEAFYRSYGVSDSRIVRAPYSVDNDFFAVQGAKGRVDRATMLTSLGLVPELPTLCFAAKLQPHKRPLDVVTAIHMMNTPANLIVIGDGPLRDPVAKSVAQCPRARLLGFVNQRAIGRWFGASDVIVLPSEFEPWGLVVNEAVAAGAVPVVSTEVGCAPDLVGPGGGAVFPVADVAALATALDSLVGDPAVLASARSVEAQVIARHSIEETARGFERAALLATG
jgi:glycosyltransferase involved in cell wall biosynthesis